MCSSGLTAGESSLCDYLLAKVVVFCIFAGSALLHWLFTPNTGGRNIIICKLLFVAVAFELAALLIALCYLGVAAMLLIEAIASLLLCACFWFFTPFIDRARARGIFAGDVQAECMSSVLVAIAFRECLHFARSGHQPDATITSDIATTDQAVKDNARLTADVLRYTINMI